MAFKKAAAPKVSATAKVPGRTNFVLGSRPDSLRAPPPAAVQRIKPGNPAERDYAKNGPNPSVASDNPAPQFWRGGGI